jgi:hypothetical protein
MSDLPKAGELVRVRQGVKGPIPFGDLGIIIKDGRQSAKIRWLNPKLHKPLESWVHYNRLERLEERTDSDRSI